MINHDIKFITCDETLHLKTGDFRSLKYETKKRIDESISNSGKRSYVERRGGHWRAPHPRQIRQLESKLRERTVIACEWTSENLVTIVFCSGAIAYLTLKPDTLDVTQILFDRYFVGKLSGQTITSVALCKSHMLFTHTDRTATLVTFGKHNTSNVPHRITDRDPQLQNIELGGSNRRAERHISWSENNGVIRALIWTVTSAEPAPWSPVLEDHANLHLYQIEGQNMNLIAYHQLENETLCAEISHTNENIIHVVEQFASQKNGVSLEWTRYSVGGADGAGGVVSLAGRRHSGAHVSLGAPARAVRRHAGDARLLAACLDGSLHVVHHQAGLTHSTRTGFIATDVRWADELIIAAEEGGRLQCYDRALSLLNHHTKFLDLAAYVRDTRRLKILATRSAKCGPLILALFSGGPLALLHITHPRLIMAWIRARRMSNAVSLLRAMDWDTEGNECLWAVNKIICAALRSGAEAVACESSAAAALGAYLAPLAALSAAAHKYHAPLHDLARKFFHHLLRRGRIEKALSLGVELCAWDVFADARWAAARRGLHALAHEARALAAAHARTHTDSACSGSCSECSSQSYSESDDETNTPSETMKSKPPPLPRVSLSNHPSLLPVTISQPDISTTSIRPNLHQYLEKDTTIWKKDIRDDTYLRNNYSDQLKPILTQSSKWHSMDGLLNYKMSPKPTLSAITEGSAMTSHSTIDILPRPQKGASYKHLFQTELREELPNTLYRYQYNNYHPSTSINYAMERHGNRTEKNKVKFSDTVTIAVMSESVGSSGRVRDTPGAAARVSGVTLTPSHKYACARPSPAAASAAPPAPAPPAPAVPAPAPVPVPVPVPEDKQKPPKIKVVHFGMV